MGCYQVIERGYEMVELMSVKLPEGFLDEENREGFLVKRKQKEVWAVELDLFVKFSEVCKAHNLTYFADSGTLLGAARHKGFIPWDDDMDVAMMRDDYDKLCKIAESEFKHPYFFQTEYTDPGSNRGHAQLRNSMTTAILLSEKEKNYKFNQGIFLDIFPLDNIPEANIRKEYYKDIKEKKMKSLEFAETYVRNGKCKYNRFYDEFEKCLKKYKDDNVLEIGNLVVMLGKRSSNRTLRDYSNTIELDFEFLKINAPIGYINELRKMYGIWQESEIANSIHGDVFFDTDVSFEKYIN